MYVGGLGVARGYLNRPELTAERFIADPFSPDPEARLYRSGDLARRRADGDLEYLGRIDHQVKIRGFRIELGEIQQVLADHPSVADCAVIAHGSAGDTRLVAFVVAADGQAMDETALRRHAAERLPDYMRPAATVSLERLPMTGNGKVDRAALGKAAQEALDSRRSANRPRTAPATPTEKTLAGIWADLLGVAEPGVDDNFFELGGHSLLATQLATRVKERFGIDLPLRALFETTTLASLADAIDRTAASPAVPGPTPVDSPIPVLPADCGHLTDAEVDALLRSMMASTGS
jgi:acyl carrier protein